MIIMYYIFEPQLIWKLLLHWTWENRTCYTYKRWNY